MTPYRELPSALAPAAGIPWRRWLVDSFADLRNSASWRRWAGGRWAEHAFVYNDSPWRDPRTVCHGFDVAAAEVYGPDADVAFDTAADLARERWRALDACPHGRVAVLHETQPDVLGVVHRAHPCTCEVHPTPRPMLALTAGST